MSDTASDEGAYEAGADDSDSDIVLDDDATDASVPAPSDEDATGEPPETGDEGVASTPPPRDINITLFGATDVGQLREHNEDNFIVADLTRGLRGLEGKSEWPVGPKGLLMAVCDGMGGAAAGEVASQLATDIIYDHMLAAAGHDNRDQLALDVVEGLERAGIRILDESNNNRAFRGMGTTATVAALVDDCLLLGQV
ncbi:MAG TPA: hypothetical protein ENK23_04945, partial [Sorangium sp.]|nr:hypothetical protein [Sorangium sp.]